MSILLRLLISVTIAIGAILLGTLLVSVGAARDYLSGQLQVQSNDAAVSLALSLSQPANNDPVIQELLVSALFDGGHFKRIELRDPEGKILIERRAPEPELKGLLGWVRTAAPFSHGPAKHAVSDGWQQLGEVTLLSNDTYAWETLWKSSVRMTALVLGAGLLWGIFAYGLVRWIKKRLLFDVSEQVKAIDRGDAGRQAYSSVSEFALVTDALNETRERVRVTNEEQSSKIESLELELNQDPVTGLANRKYFINEFRRELTAPQDDEPRLPARLANPGGHILVFRQRDLADINRHMPRDFTDQWLRSISQRVQEMLRANDINHFVLARLNGSDFVLLLPHLAAPGAMMIAETLRSELRALRLPVGEGGLCRWAQAVTDYSPNAKLGEVLARLDFGLMRAESAGNDQTVLLDDAQQHAMSAAGQTAWKDAIVSAVEEQRFSLQLTPLRQLDGQLVRHEAMLMLHNAQDAAPIPAPIFIPAAVRLNLSGECDLQAVRLALDWLSHHDGELGVVVCLPSLTRSAFLRQFELLLAEKPELSTRLAIEIDAHGLVEHPSHVAAFARVVSRCGARLGLRRLAQQFGAMAHLHSLPLSYVKIGGGFITGMLQSPGSQQLTASLIDTARGLNIEVYAENVPDGATRDILAGLGITTMQGPAIATAARA